MEFTQTVIQYWAGAVLIAALLLAISIGLGWFLGVSVICC